MCGISWKGIKSGTNILLKHGASTKHIDPHVHCRDWNWSYKATIKSVMDIAKSQGISAIFDMPNTSPPITTKELVRKRIATAKEEGCLEGYYFYLGLTGDVKQAKEAAELAESNEEVVGLKLVTCKSVGDLRTQEEEKQKRVYETLAEAGYKGVVAVHAEKEAHFSMNLWDPKKPATWNLARPPKSETEAVRDQIGFAKETGFKGTVHICHISTPESVENVNEARRAIKIVCGITPHHLMYSTLDMHGLEGLMYKVNPPLRDPDAVKKLNEQLREGKIDWIETDHAPHTREEKVSPPDGNYMSGITSLYGYADFLKRLLNGGFSERQIEKLTYSNIRKAFPTVLE